jgi:riboflavin kinase/FMN adenylyltransferase
MRIITGSKVFTKNLEGSVVTIGNFDGVHRGHAELFRLLRHQSDRLALPSVVVTFEPHPLTLLAFETSPPLITTFEQKLALIAGQGIDCLVVIEFTRTFSMFTAESFVRQILCASLGMRHIIIGHDYAFGRDRQGNYDTLARMGAELGFSLEDLDPVGEGDAVFSSSLVRRMIADGKVSEAATILGRYYAIAGRVVHGREIGHQLGFPTANIATRNDLIPLDGVYAVIVAVGDKLFEGACNIGSNPTFEGKDRTIEVFLLNFSGELYDLELEICFVRRLREERKFPNADALIQAIGRDVADCRTTLAAVESDLIKPFSTTVQSGKSL